MVEEEVWGGIVVGSVAEDACAEDFEDPFFCRGELGPTVVLVEEGEAVDAQ